MQYSVLSVPQHLI